MPVVTVGFNVGFSLTFDRLLRWLPKLRALDTSHNGAGAYNFTVWPGCHWLVFERQVDSSLSLLGPSRTMTIRIQVSTSSLLVNIGPCAQRCLQLTYLTIISIPVELGRKTSSSKTAFHPEPASEGDLRFKLPWPNILYNFTLLFLPSKKPMCRRSPKSYRKVAWLLLSKSSIMRCQYNPSW